MFANKKKRIIGSALDDSNMKFIQYPKIRVIYFLKILIIFRFIQTFRNIQIQRNLPKNSSTKISQIPESLKKRKNSFSKLINGRTKKTFQVIGCHYYRNTKKRISLCREN